MIGTIREVVENSLKYEDWLGMFAILSDMGFKLWVEVKPDKEVHIELYNDIEGETYHVFIKNGKVMIEKLREV